MLDGPGALPLVFRRSRAVTRAMAKRAPAIPDPDAMAQSGAAAGPLPGDDDDIGSAEAARPALSWPWLTLSALAHALVIAALLGLWRTAPLPEEPVVKVMLLADGRGAAGSAGGAQGGGGSAATAETASAAPAADAPLAMAPAAQATTAETTPAAEAATADAALDPAPPAAETPPPPLETAQAPSEPPPPRKPRPHHAKPKPAPVRPAQAELPTPTPTETAQSPPTPLETETKIAAAPLPEPVPGAPGTGGQTGGAAGAGLGAEGAGHGAIGGGPVSGPGDDYLDRLRRWLSKYKQYPKAAQQQKQEGGLVVSFTIARDGTVLSPAIERSSGFPLLDDAALKMLHDASPVPPLPPSYRSDHASIALPVDFSIGFFDRLF